MVDRRFQNVSTPADGLKITPGGRVGRPWPAVTVQAADVQEGTDAASPRAERSGPVLRYGHPSVTKGAARLLAPAGMLTEPHAALPRSLEEVALALARAVTLEALSGGVETEKCLV